ncbi:MAG: phosphate ABC transporter permease PstA [Thermodesulfovibrionales bacterium]|nr:phosphate ABC transporter permease PstA [Thermodesulfovibrionales bacterium]
MVNKILHNLFKRPVDSVMVLLTFIATLIIMAILTVILTTITIFGAPNLSLDFLIKAPEEGMTEGGIFPAIVGTTLLVITMSILGLPIGLITAVFLHEYAGAKSRLVNIFRFAVNNLAGVPAIVYGIFGLSFFVFFVGTQIDNVFYGGNLKWGKPALIWASCTMALLTLPVVIVSVEEALRTVTQDEREAAYALGATHWEVVYRVVIPKALGGILTGGILAVSRGAGEVAPVLFTGAAYFLPELPRSFSDQFMEMGYHIFVMSTQSHDVDATKPIQFATTLVLLLLTFSLNFVAVLMRRRIRLARR